MTATDILARTGQTEMKCGSEMDLNNPKYTGVYANGVNYWLASASDPNYLRYVYGNGYVSSNSNGAEFGVRPVVSLKSNVKTSAMDTQGRWIIEIE